VGGKKTPENKKGLKMAALGIPVFLLCMAGSV